MEHVDAWGFYESLADRDRHDLSVVEREVAAICDLRQEVNSGGFDSYFRYWGGDSAPLALGSVGRVLGAPWEEPLAEAMKLMGEPYPTNVDGRELELGAKDLAAALDALDRRFLDLESTIDADELLRIHLGSG